MSHATHDAYFESVEDDIRHRLVAIQNTVESLIPSAERCIGYNMPAYRDGKIFLYFGAFKQHVGVYPPVSEDSPLIDELARYRGPKGNLTFRHSKPLPLELIGRVAVALHRQYTQTPQ